MDDRRSFFDGVAYRNGFAKGFLDRCLPSIEVLVFYFRERAKFIIIIWSVEKEFLQRNLLVQHEIIAKKTHKKLNFEDEEI